MSNRRNNQQQQRQEQEQPDPQALAKIINAGAEMAGWTNKEAYVIQRMYAKDTTQAEFMAFGRICRVTGLDPQNQEVHCTVYSKNDPAKRSMVIVIGVNGYRKIGWSTNEVLAMEGPQWMDKDREWVDAWVEDYNPLAARFGLQRAPMIAPRWVTVTWREFAKDVNTKAGDFWKSMPGHMLAKVAESQCWRAVFPQQMTALARDVQSVGDTMPPTVHLGEIDTTEDELPELGAGPDEPFDLERETPEDGAHLEESAVAKPKPKAKGITDGAIVGAVEVAVQVAQINDEQVSAVVGDDGVVAWVRAQMGDEVTVITMNQAIAQLASMAGEAEVEA